MATRIKRQPDAGVASAIQSVMKNQKFKRMLVFGLRSLSELTVPPTIKFKENSLAVLETPGALNALVESTNVYYNDDEVVLLCGKVYWGISEGLVDETHLAPGIMDSGLLEAAVHVVNKGSMDEKSWPLYLDLFRNFNKVGISVDPSAMAPGLMSALQLSKLKVGVAVRVVDNLLIVASNETGASVLGDLQASQRLLDVARLYDVNPESCELATKACNIVRYIALTGKCKPDTVDQIINVIEHFKGKKSVGDAGSSALAVLVGPTQLKSCLESLKSAAPGSPERSQALITLSSMSYIGTYAQAVVQAGGIPLLCDAVLQAAKDLSGSSSDEKVLKGLCGACKMLGKVGENSANRLAIWQANGVPACVEALKQTSKNERAAAWPCEALAALVTVEEYASAVEKLGGFKTVIGLCTEKNIKNAKAADLFKAGASMINGAAHPSVCDKLLKDNVVEAIRVIMAASDEPLVQKDCLNALLKLVSASESLTVFEPVIEVASKSVTAGVQNYECASIGARLFESLVSMKNNNSLIGSVPIVDCMLAVMLEHEKSKEVFGSAKNVLEVIATEQDVNRALKDMERAVTNASSNPSNGYRALAAVNGLSQISRLRNAFIQNDASKTLLKGIQGWVENNKFNDQQKIVKAGLQCVENLTMGSEGPIDKNILSILDLCVVPGMKVIRDKQDPNENNLLDAALTVQRLCATQRVASPATVAEIVESIQRVMRKYPDSRKVQTACINALGSLATTCNGEGAKILVESGATKAVISYMLKVAMYEDIQVAGFRMLHNVLTSNPTLVDHLKKSDAFEACKVANRTHPRSAEVRKYMVPVSALLTPEGELERIINENMQRMHVAAKGGDAKSCAMFLRNINQVIYSPEAAKIAVRCKLGPSVQSVMDQLGAAPPADLEDFQTEMAICYKHVGQTRPGATQLAKSNGMQHMLSVFENLSKKPERAAGTEAALRACRAMFKADKDSCEIAYKKGAVAKVCAFASEKADKPEMFSAALSALGAIQNKKQLFKTPEFKALFAKMTSELNGTDKQKKSTILEALDEFLMDPDDDMVDFVCSQKVVQALYQVLEDYPDDLPMVKRAQRCLDNISKHKNLRTVLTKANEKPLEAYVMTNKRVIGSCKEDIDACCGALKVLNNTTTKLDRGVLQDTNIMAEVEELIALYPDHGELMKQLGKLLGNLGADDLIRNLMKQLIQLNKDKPPNYQKTMVNLNTKLAVYLAGDVENPAKAFEFTQHCVDSLADAMKENVDNAPVLVSVGKVTRRIAERPVPDDLTPYGAKSLATKMMPTLIDVLGTDTCNPTKRPKRFVIDGFKALSACCKNPQVRPLCIKECQKKNFLPKCQDLLKYYDTDPDVTASVLEFMTNFADCPEGAAELVNTYKPIHKRNVSDPVIEDVVSIMNRHRTHPAVIAAGLGLIGALAMNLKEAPAKLADPNFLNDLMKLAENSPEALAALYDTFKKVLDKVPPETANMMFRKALETNAMIQADSSLSQEDKDLVAGAFADLAGRMGELGLGDEVKKGGLEALIEMFEGGAHSDDVLMRTCRALRNLANDADCAAKITRNGAKFMFEEAANEIGGDPYLAKEALQLLSALADHEGNGRILASTNGLKETFEQIGLLAAELPPHEGEELKLLLEQTKRKIEDDDPGVLTLKQVYEKWKAAKDRGEKLLMSESTAVIQQIDFVFDYTEEYSKEQHKNLKSPLGSEFMYGCKCFQLLHEHLDNSKSCFERNENQFMLKAIAKQKEDLVSQSAILASNDAVQHPEVAESWATTPNAAAIVADALVRGRKTKSSVDDMEAFLIPRMELVERMAVQRTYFNGTEAMGALIGVWDDFDAGKYSIILLRQVFRSMRKIVNDHWVGIILKNNVPKRLIDVVNDLKVDHLVLPDVLFLLGTLAVVKEIKDLIGELQGVEACLELLRRQLKTPSENTSAVQTNACLALANMTIAHAPNITRFVQKKGLELNITVMEASMQGKLDYDVAGAASILMCNTCFKRDDMKELYGKKGGCQAIMKTIQKYDGSEDIRAFRCLGAMFKAIGNLALFVPNVKIFLDLGIEKTIADLYKKSEHLPDNLIETSFRTVSNLVMENTDENMVKFGILLSPILNMIKQEQRSSTTMFALAFDVLGCLCRHPQNGRKFLAEDGIPVVLKILNTYTDIPLYSYGIYVLGIQTTVPEAIPELIKHGIFEFLTSLLETQVNAPELSFDLTVSGLRCLRRLLKNQKAAQECVKSGAIVPMIGLMKRVDDHSMVHMESYRNVIALLTQFPPPAPPPQQKKKVDSEWDAEVADEGVLPAVMCLARPPSPRSWESLQLDADLISQIIESTCPIVSKEGNEKNVRLMKCALGLLAYFACEKVPDTIQAFYGANIGNVLAHVFTNFDTDPDLMKTGCYIINNVAYASEPELYVQFRRDREMRRKLDAALPGLGKAPGNAKDFCTLTLRLLNEKSADPLRFEVHMQWDYPLEMTCWDQDKYPNGVQDLPMEMRENMRTGGKHKVQLNDRDKENFYWKSSMDMSLFQWRIDPKEGPSQHSIAMSRIRCIAKGLASDLLKHANANGSATSKPKAGDCIVLQGPPSEEFPQGMELNIVCSSKRHRDAFFEMLTEWRDAATYGF